MRAFEISSGCNGTGRMEHKGVLLGIKGPGERASWRTGSKASPWGTGAARQGRRAPAGSTLCPGSKVTPLTGGEKTRTRDEVGEVGTGFVFHTKGLSFMQKAVRQLSDRAT